MKKLIFICVVLSSVFSCQKENDFTAVSPVSPTIVGDFTNTEWDKCASHYGGDMHTKIINVWQLTMIPPFESAPWNVANAVQLEFSGQKNFRRLDYVESSDGEWYIPVVIEGTVNYNTDGSLTFDANNWYSNDPSASVSGPPAKKSWYSYSLRDNGKTLCHVANDGEIVQCFNKKN